MNLFKLQIAYLIMQRVVEVSNRQILVFVYKSEKYFVAEYPFLEIATQGRTEEEALRNIQEAVEIHMKLRGDEIRLPQSEHIASVNNSLPAWEILPCSCRFALTSLNFRMGSFGIILFCKIYLKNNSVT